MTRTFVLLAALAAMVVVPAVAQADTAPPAAVLFTGAPTSSISSGVAIPADSAMFWVSGTPPASSDGDTKTQAAGALKTIETVLKSQGMTLRDVVYMRVYLVADKQLGAVDYKGWFAAYADAFNNPTNPTKTARSTIGVAGLVDPKWLVEIEAFAVYPKR